MSNLKRTLASSWTDIEVKVLTTKKEIGNTVRNNYQIFYDGDLVEVEETIGPDLTVIKFLGENTLFISALSVVLSKNLGEIQLCYANKDVKAHRTEIVVYYSENDIVDEDTRERMIFFHKQQNLDFEYFELDKLVSNSNSYFGASNRSKNY
ncbi:MAG TPA: hypothetical protein VFG45_13835 [Candidatus Nitrosocosmicus sp.]|nr:hypothetical protein [Candidatus Nitrosocosmicus sp.]